MTADKVVDASVICSLIFAEPDQAVARSMVIRHTGLYAPTLISFEVANTALKKIRARPLERDQIISLYSNFYDFSIQTTDIDLEAAILLAQREKLSIYDATYLWLALDMGIDLVTLDSDLGKAYRRLSP